MSQTLLKADSANQLIFICGSALRGQPDHDNLQYVQFHGTAHTRPTYRLHAAADGWHPAIYAVETGGVSIPGEIYEQTPVQFEQLCAAEPPHMYPGDIVLDTGATLTAFLYPQALVEQYQWPDISHLGGWAAYKAQRV